MVDLVTILEKTVSPDKNELETALKFLDQAKEQNLADLLKHLSDILKNGANSPVVRMQAGIQLKNALYSKDPTIKDLYQQRWMSLPLDLRNYIKQNVIACLGTEANRPSTAAQCVAYIACTELPKHQCEDLLPILTSNVVNPASTEVLKEASLEAIGYICQDIEPELLQPKSNEILTAIVHGMKKEEPSNHVRLAATNALLNSLEFTRSNFEVELERHIIMQVVCEASQSPVIVIRVAALECFVKIVTLYYQYMETYMGAALFPITLEAMKSPIDQVVLQGIEFWSSICDEETDLAIEASEAAEQGRPPEKTSKFYARGALQFLMPIILQLLAQQEEYDDDDEWNPCKAAGVCLMLMATCCEDNVVQFALPFIQENIKSGDWKQRDAAVMAFGSILEGPSNTTMKPIVEQAMVMLIQLLKDPSIVVRDTTAWTIGRICEILPEAVINENFLTPLLCAMVEGLTAEPRVAANVCWAFSSLAEAAYESADTVDNSSEPQTYCLSNYYAPIIEKLLLTTERPDGNQHNLRSAAYEALMEMIKNSPKDCYLTVQKATLVILERLQQVLQMEGHVQTTSDRVQFNDMQSLLCATLQSVLRKMTPADAPHISDQIMTALLHMLDSSTGKSGGVQEDALLAISTLIEVLGESFIKYMDAFKPFFIQGLKNVEEYQVCQASVGLMGDLCRALGIKILPYCDETMTILMDNLINEKLNRLVKPHILSAFGDIALTLGQQFKKYLDVVINTLHQASAAVFDQTNYEMIDYLNELREGCLDSYTGIIQGLRGEGQNSDLNLVLHAVPHMMQLIETIAKDADRNDTVVGASCGLIGDLCTAFGSHMLPLVETEGVTNLITIGRKSKTSKVKTLATWATREIRKLKN